MTTIRILLTGGTGFFGKALLRHWINMTNEGQLVAEVTVLSRDPDHFAERHPLLAAHRYLRLVKGDICDRSSLPHGQAFTHVLHAATDSTIGPQLTPQQRFDQIVDGTRNLLDLAVACGASRFLLTSSGGVYGSQPPDMMRIPEHCHTMPDPLDPTQSYSIGKRIAEHLCALYVQRYALPVVVARCFSFVGPDLPLDVHFAIGNFIRDALWRTSIQVNGDGSPVRSYLDQSDLAQWLWALMMRATPAQAYNVGSNQPISIADLAYMVRDLVAPSKSVHILGNASGDQRRNLYVPDIQKIQNELGVQVRIPLSESIIRTAAAARSRASQNGV